MSLNVEEKKGVSKLLASIKMSDVIKFPISNVLPIPEGFKDSEIIFKSKKKTYGFSVFEAIKQAHYKETVISLEKNGMNFFYTSQIEKQMLWMPDIKESIKDVEGTVVVIQSFPKPGECISKYIKGKDVQDEAIKPFLDKNLVIFQEANFYIRRENLEVLAGACINLWKEDKQTPLYPLSTLQNTTAY
ncbi:hypothetical protein JHD50_10645 [Sulfurimonas sp. MAG313]|nr:hypothetical protein [Sulfurimonas sp. MAG313]MDF1881750.1 hypothetical protein [Sulfurimonas sp. MAG313]